MSSREFTGEDNLPNSIDPNKEENRTAGRDVLQWSFSPSQLGSFYHTRCERQLAFSAARIDRKWWFVAPRNDETKEDTEWCLLTYDRRVLLEKGYLWFRDAIRRRDDAEQVL